VINRLPLVRAVILGGIGLVIAGLASLALWGVAGLMSFKTVMLLIGAIAAWALVQHPDVTLALFVLVGSFKGNPSIREILPVDLTLLTAIILLIGVGRNLVRGESCVSIPRSFALYLPIVFMTLLSLTYTPDLDLGFKKASRFLTLTCLAILVPFAVLTTLQRFKRFLVALLAMGLALALNGLSGLGGTERFGSVSDPQLTIQLGVASTQGLLILLVLFLPTAGRFMRVGIYALALVLLVALVGSGARSASIALLVGMLIAIGLGRIAWYDVAFLVAASAIALLTVKIPEASYLYLQTLLHPSRVLSFRGVAMSVGWNLAAENPVFGVGIAGYSHFSPNPLLFNWPHNVFIEIAAELGVPAAMAFVGLTGCAIWTAVKSAMASRNNQLAPISALCLMLSVLSVLTMLNTGDINDTRMMWLYLSLPYIVRSFSDRAERARRMLTREPLYVERTTVRLGATREPQARGGGG
jgi:O-antigen ligase